MQFFIKSNCFDKVGFKPMWELFPFEKSLSVFQEFEILSIFEILEMKQRLKVTCKMLNKGSKIPIK